MSRYSTVLAAALLIVGTISAAESKKIAIRWHGQSFFELESSQGTRLVFDPHTIEAYGRKSVRADAILISHFHSDHTQVDVVENRNKAKLLLGLKNEGKKADWNAIDEKVEDIRIRTVGVYHDHLQGMERGKNSVFIVEVDGLRVVHLGDLGHLLSPAQVKAIGPVDVLMIPVGGVYTLNGAEAKKVVEQLKPRQYVIPMHYGTEVYEDLLSAQEFLDEQKNVKKFPGNKLEVETDFKPTEPIIAVLGWK